MQLSNNHPNRSRKQRSEYISNFFTRQKLQFDSHGLVRKRNQLWRRNSEHVNFRKNSCFPSRPLFSQNRINFWQPVLFYRTYFRNNRTVSRNNRFCTLCNYHAVAGCSVFSSCLGSSFLEVLNSGSFSGGKVILRPSSLTFSGAMSSNWRISHAPIGYKCRRTI